MSYQTSRSSRLMTSHQDNKNINLNLSQIELPLEERLFLPVETAELTFTGSAAQTADVRASEQLKRSFFSIWNIDFDWLMIFMIELEFYSLNCGRMQM